MTVMRDAADRPCDEEAEEHRLEAALEMERERAEYVLRAELEGRP